MIQNARLQALAVPTRLRVLASSSWVSSWETMHILLRSRGLAAPELTKKLSRMIVAPCGLTMWKMSAVEDMRGMAPSFPIGRGKGRTWIRLHNTRRGKALPRA